VQWDWDSPVANAVSRISLLCCGADGAGWADCGITERVSGGHRRILRMYCRTANIGAAFWTRKVTSQKRFLCWSRTGAATCVKYRGDNNLSRQQRCAAM